MKRYALLLCLTLCACGTGSVDVDYHTVTKEQLAAISGKPMQWGQSPVWGHTIWEKENGEIVEADIFLLAYEEYPSDDCFQEVLIEEELHAEYGHWHPLPWHEPPACQLAREREMFGY